MRMSRNRIYQTTFENRDRINAGYNVGHLYESEQVVKDFHQELDPTNTFNQGIGKTSKSRRSSD